MQRLHELFFCLLALLVMTKACSSPNKPKDRAETMTSSYAGSSMGSLAGRFDAARIPYRFGGNVYEEIISEEGTINNVRGVYSGSSVTIDEKGQGTYNIVAGRIQNK